MSQKRRKPKAPDFAAELRRVAAAHGVPAEALDQALIIGQIAGILSTDPNLAGKIAHKGAAVLRLVHESPRLSADLDSGEIRGKRLDPREVKSALESPQARKFIRGVKPAGVSKDGCAFLLDCLRLTRGTITIKISVNWSEPFVLDPVSKSYTLPDGTPIAVPVMQAVEAAAEKVRAFLARGEATDAFDLWFYWTSVLKPDDRRELERMIKRKLRSPTSRVPKVSNLLERFDEMRETATAEWRSGKGLVVEGPKPDWREVDDVLGRFKSYTPRTL